MSDLHADELSQATLAEFVKTGVLEKHLKRTMRIYARRLETEMKKKQRAGVRAASRKAFLDDVETRDAIIRRLDLATRDAVREGSAIGHPHPATLAERLPRLKSSRVRLTFASSLVH